MGGGCLAACVKCCEVESLSPSHVSATSVCSECRGVWRRPGYQRNAVVDIFVSVSVSVIPLKGYTVG